MASTEWKAVYTPVKIDLFRFRITPHTTTGVSPTEILRSRSKLDLIHPDLAGKVEAAMKSQGTDKPACSWFSNWRSCVCKGLS